MQIEKNTQVNRFFFPCLMWLLSRIPIAIALLLIAPALPVPPRGVLPSPDLSVFAAWDTAHYRAIATLGYEYINDGGGHNIAFFPLFSLLIRGLMTIGLPFNVAGILVNNLAFLGALIVIYLWVEEFHGINAARWSTAVLAWFPLSLFGTVIYTEGLYLFLSTSALRAFDKQQYLGVALWGALATATRPTGIALIPALLIATWKERRPIKAYIASVAAAAGLLLFSLYCLVQFHDPLAFISAQRGWRPSLGFDWQGWLKMVMQVMIGTANWRHRQIVDIGHPLLFVSILVSGWLLWRYHQKLGKVKTEYGFCLLGLILWLLGGDPLINLVMFFGGAYLLWYLRHQLNLVTVLYGFCGLALIISSGATLSLSRIIYGIVSLSVGLGLVLARHQRLGYATMGFFCLLMVTISIRFAQKLWVA
jgi:Gpi18-like mannosyltransferase